MAPAPQESFSLTGNASPHMVRPDRKAHPGHTPPRYLMGKTRSPRSRISNLMGETRSPIF